MNTFEEYVKRHLKKAGYEVVKLDYQNLPDFLVMDNKNRKHIFIEVKNRERFNYAHYKKTQALQLKYIKLLKGVLIYKPSSKYNTGFHLFEFKEEKDMDITTEKYFENFKMVLKEINEIFKRITK